MASSAHSMLKSISLRRTGASLRGIGCSGSGTRPTVWAAPGSGGTDLPTLHASWAPNIQTRDNPSCRQRGPGVYVKGKGAVHRGA